ncbi:hypothetical protein EZS27_029511 [termite gut metagenome]|uniref:Outer membrane protein beta-barrel domain-containing protein n=1 Tax=termite gut metagenome TaxID=433724 RepID=A0A5J4QIG9_9ZZZZ
MKKIVKLLCIAVCIFGMAMPVGAQIGLGVKGGLNLSRAPKTTVGANGKVGFFIGPMAELTIPIIGLGVDGAFLYSQKGGKIEEESAVQQGIEIPVNLKYSIGLGSIASIFVAAGPDFYFNLKSDSKLKTIKTDYSAAELGINIGGGIKVLGHFQLGVNYTIPVSSAQVINATTGEKIPSASYKNRVGQVSIAYLF